ncbi:hypothetical protein BOVMAS33_05610 [Streptococcus uberis]
MPGKGTPTDDVHLPSKLSKVLICDLSNIMKFYFSFGLIDSLVRFPRKLVNLTKANTLMALTS